VAPDSFFFDEIPCDLKFSCNLPIRSRVDFCSEALGNPHLHPEQPEWSSDSGKSDEGINPLRRLKREMATSAAVEADRDAGRAPATVAALELKERRRSPRLRCSGGVELQGAGSEVRRWELTHRHQPAWMLCGNEQHISCCYENEPCPEIVRHPDSVVGHRSGLVSGFGQGLCFSEIEPVEQFELQ
jgi:hypothetical protein